MKKKGLAWLLVCVFALSAGFLSACKQTSVREVRLWVYEPDTLIAKQAYKSTVEQFSNRHGITVEVSFVDKATYTHKLDKALADNHAPDVLMLEYENIADYAAQKTGFLMPINNYLRLSDIKLPKMADNARRACNAEIQTLGVPYTLNSDVVLYNKALVKAEDVPKTWDELLVAGEKAYKDGSTAFAGLTDAAFAARVFLAMLSGEDGAVLNKAQTQTAFDGEDGREAATVLASLQKLALPNQADLNAFALSKAAFTLADETEAAKLAQNFPDLKFGAVPMPGKTEKSRAAVLGGTALVMSKNALNKEKSFALIAYLSQPETSKKLMSAAGGLSADLSLLTPKDEVGRMIADLALLSNPLPQLPGFMSVKNNVLPAAMQAIFSGQEVSEALTEAAAQTKSLLFEREREKSPTH